MEWAGRLLADGVIENVNDIRAQRPNGDTSPTFYGGTPYSDRFVPWMTDFPVAIEDRWFGGPVSHPYPGVSSCRTDSALAGNPRVPVVGLPDCEEVPAGTTARADHRADAAARSRASRPTTSRSSGSRSPRTTRRRRTPGSRTRMGVHMQAFRLGDILFTVCSCEQWADQAFNIKTRTDTQPGNEYLGYDPTDPNTSDRIKCTREPGRHARGRRLGHRHLDVHAAVRPGRHGRRGRCPTTSSSTCARRSATTRRAGTTRPAPSSAAASRPSPSRPTCRRSAATTPTTTPTCAAGRSRARSSPTTTATS